MKDKWIDYITQITLLIIIFVLTFVTTKVIVLNKKLDEQIKITKELQERTLNHEYKLEDITIPNDDLP